MKSERIIVTTRNVLGVEQAEEIPQFLRLDGEQLYCVYHQPCGADAVVLLAGPFVTERPTAYIPWVRWARFLARHRFGAMRFDYRGVGESSGNFESMCFSTWMKDLYRVADHVKQVFGSLPLLLHGLGLGGVLAANAFSQGLGEALTMWSAPQCGTDVLRDALRRQLAIDLGDRGDVTRKTYAGYMEDLAAGRAIEVDGYRWSKALWQDAATITLPDLGSESKRPWTHVILNRSHTPLFSGFGPLHALDLNPFLKPVPLNPNLDSLFSETLNWIEQTRNTVSGKAI
jgi:hypothetical protein